MNPPSLKEARKSLTRIRIPNEENCTLAPLMDRAILPFFDEIEGVLGCGEVRALGMS
jgi:hypothetical protein